MKKILISLTIIIAIIGLAYIFKDIIVIESKADKRDKRINNTWRYRKIR